MKIKSLFIVTVVFLIASCKSNKNESTETITKELPAHFDYGQVTDNLYTNEYFGMNIEIPVGWHVQSQEFLNKISEEGKELIAGDDKNIMAVVEASEIKTANLLGAFKYELGASVPFNPNFMMVSENIKSYSGINSGSDYLFHTRRFLLQSQLQYSAIDSTFSKTNINGMDFYHMQAILNLGNFSITQQYFAGLTRGFCLTCIISYQTEEQKTELEKMLNTLKFN